MAESTIKGHLILDHLYNGNPGINTNITLSASILNYDFILVEAGGYNNTSCDFTPVKYLTISTGLVRWLPLPGGEVGYKFSYRYTNSTQLYITDKGSSIQGVSVYGVKI